MQAVKMNRVYTITEAEVDSFQKQGYDILDDNGKVVAYGAGKTVPFGEYMKVVEELEALKKKSTKPKTEKKESKEEKSEE